MLDNTSIFESAENKELDQLIKRYEDLTAQAKDIKTSLEQITDRIKTICNRQAGTYETLNKVFALNSSTKVAVDTVKLAEQYKKVWKLIPPSVLSVKMTDLRKSYNDILEVIPEDALIKTTTLSMGTIRTKTNI